MVKKLMQTKRDYENYISEYMYENHISFKTLEQTKQTWRTERAYTEQIEAELIKKSKLFMSLLPKELDLKFRQRSANFIADYLSVYVSKSKEFADEKDATKRKAKAYAKINNQMLIWLNAVQQNKKARKSKPEPKETAQKTHKKSGPKYKKYLMKQQGKVIQEITFGNEKVTFTYDDMQTFRRNYRTDIARVINTHTK
ncbi:MAG: hypothetical protein J5620_02005 [Alphaproteobacteria bacterium]|nr:hypothetical protein [Alphaproteobacteria bacterium]